MNHNRQLPLGLKQRYTINDRVFEVSERGVYLVRMLNSGSTHHACKILDRKGNIDVTTSGLSAKIVGDALEAQERWNKEQRNKTVEIQDSGWTIQRDFDKHYVGNLVALSPYKPRSIAYLERDKKGQLRVRVDNNTNTQSKSVPVEVVLTLVGKYSDLRDGSNWPRR